MLVEFRAKELNKDNYVIGCYIEKDIDCTCIIDRDAEQYEIDKSTLSISFNGMIDSQGNKIFASLNEDGKGGDRLIENGRIEDGFNPIYEPYFRKDELYIDDLPKSPYGQFKFKYFKVIGIKE